MGKGLEEILRQKKAVIAKEWFHHAIQAYAPETAEFLKSKTDAFANPVGSATLNGIKGLLDQLIHEMRIGRNQQVRPGFVTDAM